MTREDAYQVARQKIAFVFSKYQTGLERIEEIIAENGEEIDASENAAEIVGALRGLASQNEKGSFVDAVVDVLKPIIDRGFELKQQEFEADPEERVYVANELLKYTIRSDKMTIHVLSGELATGVKKYIEGLSIVAEVLDQHPEVALIEAKSFIVLEHPRILESLGFTVDRDAEGRIMVEVTGEGKKRGRATMARENFLAKYLLKK